MPDQPFAGVEVVEFGQFIAVPWAAQLLGEGGAHVIKVESLDGDPVRAFGALAPGESRLFISRNRGKHTLPLDLRHPAAAAVIDALVARADVVLTNLRPGLARDLGLDYASLSARFPRLIVGNVTAFGEHGPDAGLAGMDIVVQARSGLMAANGRTRDGLPIAGDPPVADYMCATLLAFGIASALLRRERTGHGGQVDVSLLMAALVFQNNLALRVESVDGPVHREALDRLAALRNEGAPHAEQAGVMPGFRVTSMSSVYYRTFATKDATLTTACPSPGLQRALMRAVGLRDEAHERDIARDDQPEHYARLQAEIEAVIASRTTAEWKEIFDAHGIPGAGVKFPIEMLDDPQALANGMLRDLPHPALGPVRVLAPPLVMDSDGFRPTPAALPFGSEAADILASLGFTTSQVEALFAANVTRDQPPGA